MKSTLRNILGLLMLGLPTIACCAATPVSRIDRIEWVTFLAWNSLTPGPTFAVHGNGMSDVSVCALVAEGTSREYPVELLETTATRIRAKLPDPSPTKTLIPPGRYHLKIGVPGQTVVSAAVIRVGGTTVTEFTSSSVQSLVRIEFKGYLLKQVTRGLLRSDQGEVYGPWKSFEAADSSEALTGVWNSVPAGTYDVILKSADNLTLWISPTKFRVFANPMR